MELTKSQLKKLQDKLPHITGVCDCPTNKKCIYWDNVDKDYDWQTKMIIKVIKEL